MVARHASQNMPSTCSVTALSAACLCVSPVPSRPSDGPAVPASTALATTAGWPVASTAAMRAASGTVPTMVARPVARSTWVDMTPSMTWSDFSTFAVQWSHIMPPTLSVVVVGRSGAEAAVRPAFSTAARSAARGAVPTTIASAASRSTWADNTPSTSWSAFSTFALQ